MKLRITKDTIVFRLTREEMEVLRTAKEISDKVFISEENQLEYFIKSRKTANNAIITFTRASIKATVPQSTLDDWLDSKKIGITASIITEKGDSVTLKIEEDLPPRKLRKNTQ